MHHRLDRVGTTLTIADATGDRMLLEHAVYLKRVDLVHDPAFTFLGGNKGEAYYVRLCKRLTGGSFIEHISPYEAGILRNKGCPFEELGGGVYEEMTDEEARTSYQSTSHPVEEPIRMTMKEFNTLPCIEDLGERVPRDGFWAKRYEEFECIFVAHRGHWVEREVAFG